MIILVQFQRAGFADGTNAIAFFTLTTSDREVVQSQALVDLASYTPAALLAEVKNRAIAWAADPANGGATVTADQVFVFGGPQ